MRWILVEAADRILPEVSTAMAGYTTALLRRRHIEVRLDTRLASAEGGRILLDDGEEFPAGTLVWTAGAAPSPLTRRLSGLPTDGSGRIIVDDFLAVQGTDGAWALGDAAAVPYLAAGAAAGKVCAPTAQHAYRQAGRLAGNIVAVLRGREPRPYWHASAGSVASLGLYRGVAEVYGLRMHGFPAWMTHRTYHLLRLPTLNRRLHVVADWTLALAFPREIVSLDVLEHPRQDFRAALDLIASGPPQVMPSAGAATAGSAEGQGEAEHAHHQQARRRAVRPGSQRGCGAGGSRRERARRERAREHGRLGARLPASQTRGVPAGARGHRRVPGMRGPQRRGCVRAPRRVHPPGRTAVRWGGDRRRHRMLPARLPLRPGIRPGTLTACHPAGRRLPRPNRRGRRIRTPGCLREEPPETEVT